ncbi:Alpha/beta hydrolase family protein [Auraticoccus monumenti]|uniref:Alpha/beta hydrolase family protein n=1 Tax=Auraticoccus monumenti TaxID=675864 RepID=A0A1G6YRG9_9ACTN|nr:Alpha/beta hydrolase family protein [Auraticoccus monumenti]
MHGLYHQPAHLLPLIDALAGHGAVVHAPRLHRGSLAADTSAVQRVVDRCRTKPIIVGHSYGGAVASGVRGAAALIFMAAFVPDVGESCADLGGPDAPVNAWVRPHPAGGTYIPAGVAPDLFYADCSTDATTRAVDLLVPQAPGHGRGTVRAASWRQTTSHYIVCSRDRALSPERQQRLAGRCTSQETIEASHSPYISQPAGIAATIITRGVVR